VLSGIGRRQLRLTPIKERLALRSKSAWRCLAKYSAPPIYTAQAKREIHYGSNAAIFFGRRRPGFGSLFREVERVFDDFSRRLPSGFASSEPGVLNPRIDVSETPEALEITAELPGVREQDVAVTLTNGTLTIRGEKKIERERKDKNWHVTERRSGAFVRSIPLAFEPEQNAIEAHFENAVLKIRLPKPQEAVRQSTRIPVTSTK
jgi:HSP20 family protein